MFAFAELNSCTDANFIHSCCSICESPALPLSLSVSPCPCADTRGTTSSPRCSTPSSWAASGSTASVWATREPRWGSCSPWEAWASGGSWTSSCSSRGAWCPATTATGAPTTESAVPPEMQALARDQPAGLGDVQMERTCVNGTCRRLLLSPGKFGFTALRTARRASGRSQCCRFHGAMESAAVHSVLTLNWADGFRQTSVISSLLASKGAEKVLLPFLLKSWHQKHLKCKCFILMPTFDVETVFIYLHVFFLVSIIPLNKLKSFEMELETISCVTNRIWRGLTLLKTPNKNGPSPAECLNQKTLLTSDCASVRVEKENPTTVRTSGCSYPRF